MGQLEVGTNNVGRPAEVMEQMAEEDFDVKLN